jgi:MbtH protein
MSSAQHPDACIDGDTLIVLVNAEGQHSIWPAGLPVPDGWSQTGAAGSKAACLAYVETAWRDMRPRSLQAAMGGKA